MVGRLITLEGGEGAGKTTQLGLLRDYLQSANLPLLVTREPGGTALGEQIRSILLDRNNHNMSVAAETLLLCAARAQHVQQVIRPALAAGYWVLCDRFSDATYAYQGGGRGLPFADIATLERWVLGDLVPDLTLLFDVPVALGMARVQQRGVASDRFEQEQLEFFERVRLAYLQRAADHPQRYVVLDASRPLQAVRLEVEQCLVERGLVRTATVPAEVAAGMAAPPVEHG